MTNEKKDVDWKYWLIMMGFLLTIICIIIPKIQIEMIKKPDKCICECNCNIKEEYSWDFNNFTFDEEKFNITFVNLSENYQNNETIKEK